MTAETTCRRELLLELDRHQRLCLNLASVALVARGPVSCPESDPAHGENAHVLEGPKAIQGRRSHRLWQIGFRHRMRDKRPRHISASRVPSMLIWPQSVRWGS